MTRPVRRPYIGSASEVRGIAGGVKVEENTGTTPTISIHGFGPLAPSGAVNRMRRPITLPPGARRSAKAWSTMTAGDVGCASAAVNPRPARTRTSNTSNRFVATTIHA